MNASDSMDLLREMFALGKFDRMESEAIRWALDTIDRLPKDAEGNPVTPDMVLWGWVPRHDGSPGRIHQQNWMTAKVDEIAKCYSTPEAAEAAAKQPKEGPHDEDSH